MSTLERAIEIALEVHRGCKDKGGKPYILHPLHVMLQMKSNDGKIVGVLHDVAEDSDDWNLERLRSEGFSGEIVDAIDSVTKRDG
ncbi:MAG: GTP pyrophosphokinase, partial [Myxococcota bacterium]